MKTIFVYNPKSGGSFSKKALAAKMRQHDLSVDTWLPISDEFSAKLAKLLREKCLVYVCGGDGTQSAAASVITGTSSIMAPLPGGTLNHFTKDLGIDQDIDIALDHLVHSRNNTRIDIASVNGEYFVNNASIGLYARSLKEREQLEQKLSKWTAAVIGVIRTLTRFKYYRLKLDGEPVHSPIVYVGNNQYSFEAGQIGTRTALNEGVLTVATVKETRVFATIRLALKVAFGYGLQTSRLDVSSKTSLKVQLKQPRVRVARDGEVELMNTPLNFVIHPGKLNVRLPE